MGSTAASSSTGVQLNPDNPSISWPTQRPTEEEPGWRPPRPAANGRAITKPPPTLDPSNYPGGKKSLAGISIRAFLIGVTFGISTCLTILFSFSTPLWRVPCFMALLCLFHFLEYYVTARYNTMYASVSAFLLTSNGWAYNAANIIAFAECILSHLIFPESYFKWTEPIHGVKPLLVVGFVLVVVGQTVRTLAMAQAGSNFNHTVQVERKEGHMLVTSGIYGLLRHPSYFGFFWWGLGTQLVLGNVLCLASHAFVLWNFFNTRIKREERFLLAFFGDEYVNYKKRTAVGIPGIR